MLKQLSIAAILIAGAAASEHGDESRLRESLSFDNRPGEVIPPTFDYAFRPTGKRVESRRNADAEEAQFIRSTRSQAPAPRTLSSSRLLPEEDKPSKHYATGTPFGDLVFETKASKKSSKHSDSESSSSSSSDEEKISKRSLYVNAMPSKYVNSKGEEKKISKVKKLSKVSSSYIKDGKRFIVSVKRNKDKSKKSDKGKSRKSRVASAQGTLEFKHKHSYILNVATDMSSGIEVTNDGSAILKTKGKNARDYAILPADEKYSIGVSALKKKKEGKVMMQFSKIKASSKIEGANKKRAYRYINAPVRMSDASSVCEMFGYEFDELHPEDVKAVVDHAEKYASAGHTGAWIGSIAIEKVLDKEKLKEYKNSLIYGLQMPAVLNFNSYEPAIIAPEIEEAVEAKMQKAIKKLEEYETGSSRHKKHLKDERNKLRSFVNKLMAEKDYTERRMVLCRVK